MPSIKIVRLFFTILLMVLSLPGFVTAQAQTQPPNDGPNPQVGTPYPDDGEQSMPETLNANDRAQVEDLLPEAAVPYFQEAYVKASNTDATDIFGSSVAISGDTLVIGAPGEASDAKGVNGPQGRNVAKGAGAVYVFVRNGSTWSQQAYLKASNAEKDDGFGGSVAISGNTIVVGAIGEDSISMGVNNDQTNNAKPGSGAAYVFVRNGTTWSQQAYLKASNTDEGDAFGGSLAIFGDTILIGAPREDSSAKGLNGDPWNNLAEDSGAAYIFTRTGVTWTQRVYVKSSDSFGAFDFYSDLFGTSAAMSGNTIVVGAPWSNEKGGAYIFTGSGSSWTEQAKLTAPHPDYSDTFGGLVAISGDTVVVGAAGEDSKATGVDGDATDETMNDSGAAYVFVRKEDGTWKHQAYLKASNTEAYDHLSSVGISGNTVVVGAMHEDSAATGPNGDQVNNSALSSGAVYVFRRNGITWDQRAYLKASNTNQYDNFGDQVAIYGSTIVSGAKGEASAARGINGNQADNSANEAGAAYVFSLPAYVASIKRDDPSPTTAASVSYTVTFSEAVTGVNTSDFALTASAAGASVVGVSGGPKVYNVLVSTGSGSGSLSLNLVDNDSIKNAKGVPLGGAGVGNGNLAGEMYAVRPITVTFLSQGQQDGWLLESNETSHTGGWLNNTSPVFRLGDDASNRQCRAILHFATGTLPDTAVITKATLKIRRNGGPLGTDPFTTHGDLRVEIGVPFFGSTSALELADFDAAASIPSVAGLFDPVAVDNWYSAAFGETGKTNISRTTPTQYRLRFVTDDNNNATADFIWFFSGNVAESSVHPALVVEYYLP